MLTVKKLFFPEPQDVCPNCGEACAITAVLCPKCGRNLDELFDQLPDFEESSNIFKFTSKHLSFLTWLTPLLFIISPLIVSLIIVLPFALKVPTTSDRSPLQLIWHVVPDSILTPSIFLATSVIPLFLSTTPPVRAKLGQRLAIGLATLFSILSVIAFWSGLQFTSIMSVEHSFAFFGIEVFLGLAKWVNYVGAGGILLAGLNLMTVIGQEKTA